MKIYIVKRVIAIVLLLLMIVEMPVVSRGLQDLVNIEEATSQITLGGNTEENKEYISSHISYFLHDGNQENDFPASISITSHPVLTLPSPPPDLI